MDNKLQGLDLNLLLSLNAILEEQSVSHAAEKLYVAQPTMSVALRRLRDHFGDDILSRHGNTYVLTSLATALVGPTAAAIESVQAVFNNVQTFDPASSEREFVICGNDHAAATIGVEAVAIAADRAPGVFLRFANASARGPEEEMGELERCDATLLPPGLLPGASRANVLNDHWVCLLSETNTVVGETITLDQMGSLPWIVTHQSRSAPRPALVQLQILGIVPRVVGSVDSFLALPLFLAGTDRIGLVPSGLAEVLVGRGLRAVPCPYEAVDLTVTMYWHRRHTGDHAHRWMREIVREAGMAASRTRDLAPATT